MVTISHLLPPTLSFPFMCAMPSFHLFFFLEFGQLNGSSMSKSGNQFFFLVLLSWRDLKIAWSTFRNLPWNLSCRFCITVCFCYPWGVFFCFITVSPVEHGLVVYHVSLTWICLAMQEYWKNALRKVMGSNIHAARQQGRWSRTNSFLHNTKAFVGHVNLCRPSLQARLFSRASPLPPRSPQSRSFLQTAWHKHGSFHAKIKQYLRSWLPKVNWRFG